MPRGTGNCKCFRSNENKKKRYYDQQGLQVENGSFTPLVCAADSGMRKECTHFYKRLAEMIAGKRKVSTSFVTKRSRVRCLTGSRSTKISSKRHIDNNAFFY